MLEEAVEGLAVIPRERPAELSPGFLFLMEGLDDAYDGSTHGSPQGFD